MKIAKTFDQVEEKQLDLSVISDPYINAFAQRMMELSNDLNEDDSLDVDDIKEEYFGCYR